MIFSEQARDTDGKPPENLSSYDSVILFHQYWRTYDRAMFGRVKEQLENAIRRDPDYAEAFACLSIMHSNWRRFGHEVPARTPDPRERALALARRAIELAPSSSRGYHALALAYWFNGDLDASLEALQTGLGLNPNDTEIMSDLGLRHAMLMQWDKAVPLLEASYARNPAQPGNYRLGLALWHYMAGRYEQALTEARRANIVQVVYGYKVIAAAAAQLGRQEEAEAAVTSILRIAPDYGDRIITDGRSRYAHPDIVAALGERLRKAGLAGREVGPRDAAEDRGASPEGDVRPARM